MEIKFGGKERLFSFGLGFLGELIEDTGLDISQVLIKLETNPIKYIPEYMYHSSKYAYESKGMEFSENVYDFKRYIEEEKGIYTSDGVKKFCKKFIESLHKDVYMELVPEEDQEEVKKK